MGPRNVILTLFKHRQPSLAHSPALFFLPIFTLRISIVVPFLPGTCKAGHVRDPRRQFFGACTMKGHGLMKPPHANTTTKDAETSYCSQSGGVVGHQIMYRSPVMSEVQTLNLAHASLGVFLRSNTVLFLLTLPLTESFWHCQKQNIGRN